MCDRWKQELNSEKHKTVAAVLCPEWLMVCSHLCVTWFELGLVTV